MKKSNNKKYIKNMLKKNTKLLIGLIAGILVATTTTVYGAIKMSSSDVSYDKTTSGLNSSNVQDAIDELKTKANSCGSGGLQVGDYFRLVPDNSTYTIEGSLTGYKPYISTSTTASATWSNTSYYCCSSTLPEVSRRTGYRTMEKGKYTKGDAISGKYCVNTSSTSQEICEDPTSLSNLIGPDQYLYKSNANATSTSTTTSCTKYGATKPTTAISQTITPNELTLWRVININDNGTYDAVSEYVSSTKVSFEGTTGYQKYVGTLQTIAASYAKSGYTVGTRMMGYDGQTLTLSNTSAFDGTSNTKPSETSTPIITSGTGQNYTKYSTGDLGDTLYIKDYLLVQNVYQADNNTIDYCSTGLCAYEQGTTAKATYYLSSRDYNATLLGNVEGFEFGSFHVDGVGTGTAYGNVLRKFLTSSGTWQDDIRTDSVRPIITLKSDVTISGGHGFKSEPYTFS